MRLVVDAMSELHQITPIQSHFAIGKPWHQCANGEHHSETWMWQGADATSAQHPITPTHSKFAIGKPDTISEHHSEEWMWQDAHGICERENLIQFMSADFLLKSRLVYCIIRVLSIQTHSWPQTNSWLCLACLKWGQILCTSPSHPLSLLPFTCSVLIENTLIIQYTRPTISDPHCCRGKNVRFAFSPSLYELFETRSQWFSGGFHRPDSWRKTVI